jgi:hypothetical protein
VFHKPFCCETILTEARLIGIKQGFPTKAEAISHAESSTTSLQLISRPKPHINNNTSKIHASHSN